MYIPLIFILLWYLYEYLIFFLGLFSLFNLIFILLAYFWTLKKVPPDIDFEPNVSVIIPAFNEEKVIAGCIETVFSTNYDIRKIEVICADDGSTDKTSSIVRNKIKKYPHLRLLKLGHSGKSPSLNSAVKQAKYDIIISLDADMVIEKDFIKKIVAPLKNGNVGYSFGIVKIGPTDRHLLLEYYQSLEFLYMNLVRLSTSLIFSYPVWFSGPCACYRKSALLKAGGFGSDTLTEDFDISLKLYRLGYKSAFAKDAVAYTTAMTTVKKLTKQRMRWFYGGIQNLLKHKSLTKTGSLAITYTFLSYFLWFLNSIAIFPRSLKTYTVNLTSTQGVLSIIANNTFLGTFKFIKSIFTTPFSDMSFLVYGLIGILLYVLYFISIVFIGKKFTLQMVVALFTYFIYLTYLQGCFILSLIYYPLSGIKSFDRK